MGVKDLWSILAPVGVKAGLYDLRDKTVAVDLSCWVCENQAVGEKYVPSQPRMYLRNIFFRTSVLLMMNITPVFVLDGEPPDCKQDAIAKRIGVRYNQHNKENYRDDQTEKKKKKRSRLKGILKQCREMLESMGLECVESTGEAEALCALLNKQGIVDGVITQDSDAFLYGAKTIYKNFTIHLGTGSVEIFKMEDIESKLNLTRDKLIAMSLLCGCDYNGQGLQGVGKETSMKFLEVFNGGNILDRLESWRNDKVLERYENEKLNCTKCSHMGKLREHNKNGCESCGMSHGCQEDTSPSSFKNLSEEKRKIVNLEMGLRRKALSDPNFPDKKTMNEFLNCNITVPKLRKTWLQPQVVKFVRFTYKMLEWERSYCFEKIVPLSTRWELLNRNYIDFWPETIIKKRIVKGVPSYEIYWSSKNENITSLICLIENEERSDLIKDGRVLTVEPQTLIIENCNRLHEGYMTELESKKPKKKQKKVKPKPKPIGDIEKYLVSENDKDNKKEMQKEKSPEKENLQTENENPPLEDDFTERIRKLMKQSKAASLGNSSQSCSNESRKILPDVTNIYDKNSTSHRNEDVSAEKSTNISGESSLVVSDRKGSFNFRELLAASEEIATVNRSDVQDFNLSEDSSFVGYFSLESSHEGTVDLNDSTTQEYDADDDLFDISAIVNTIVSRRQFY